MSLCELKSLSGSPLPEKERQQPSPLLERPGLIWSLVYLCSLICHHSPFFQFFKEIMYLSTWESSEKAVLSFWKDFSFLWKLLSLSCFHLFNTYSTFKFILHYHFLYNSVVPEPPEWTLPVICAPRLALIVDVVMYLFVFLSYSCQSFLIENEYPPRGQKPGLLAHHRILVPCTMPSS